MKKKKIEKKPTYSQITWAVQTALKEAKDQNALVYLKGLDRSREEYGEHGFQVQLLYALSNLQYWRGETAKKAKAIMKAYANYKETE